MIAEILIVCVTVCFLFKDYISAKAELIEELAREKEIENNKKENIEDDEGI